jgi:hypothetical protein
MTISMPTHDELRRTPVTPIVWLSSLTASPEYVDVLAEDAGDVRGKEVVFDCRRFWYPTPRFCHRLIERFVLEDGAASLQMAVACADFWELLEPAARALGVADRVHRATVGVLFVADARNSRARSRRSRAASRSST